MVVRKDIPLAQIWLEIGSSFYKKFVGKVQIFKGTNIHVIANISSKNNVATRTSYPCATTRGIE